MSIFDLLNVKNNLESCLLPKLKKNVEECDIVMEYEYRAKNIALHFENIITVLDKVDLQDSTLLSIFIILYKELQAENSSQTEKCKEYCKKFDAAFDLIHGITLRKALHNDVCNIQEVFNECMRYLHKKLTIEEFKRYPSLIEVYCSLIEDVKESNICLNAATVMPITLILIEDYRTDNKIKGLNCCIILLQHLAPKDFENGNYHEVIFRSLKKNLEEKNVQVTKLLINCFLVFFEVLPSNVKSRITEEVFTSVIDLLYSESNLYRKAAFINFVKSLLEILGVNSVNRKRLKLILQDNIDICCNEGISDILLNEVLECLSVWITKCWCIWRFPLDHKLLSTLFKLLYVHNNKHTSTQIQNLILTLISLCKADEQRRICENLDKYPQFRTKELIHIMESIKNNMLV